MERYRLSCGSLTNLEELDLDGNQLSGAIPSELGSLSSLEQLILHSNQLSGAIPSELGSLSNLVELRLHSNQLSGSIPSELGSLSSLEDLDLSENQLSGAMPSELGSLSNLVELRLHSNRLTGPLPQSFTNLTHLRGFSFGANAGLCAPTDAAFQTWLQRMWTRDDGPNCSASTLGAPTIGAVTPGAGLLAVSRTAPSSVGGSAITVYDLRHMETASDETVDSNWTVVDLDGNGTGDDPWDFGTTSEYPTHQDNN